MIGIIFHHQKLNRIVKNKEAHENISFYYQLAEQNSVDLLFYSLWGLELKRKKVLGYLYSHKDKTLTRKVVDIPKINILRTIIKRKNTYYSLKEIENKYNITFINMIPERNKLKIHKYLSSYKDLRDHIPNTRRLNQKNFEEFMDRYSDVVIKPINGSRGEKIYKVSKSEQGFTIHHTRQQKQLKLEVPSKQIYLFLKKRFKYPSMYLIQEWIHFKELDGDKFDIRVSVQKDGSGKWKIPGMVVRAAAKNGIVTNIAQGGRAISFQQITTLLSSFNVQKLKDLSIKIAKAIENQYPSTADLGLDIAIDQEDKLWFIEANHCDEKYSYYESADLEMWQASYATPFEYAYAEYIKN